MQQQIDLSLGAPIDGTTSHDVITLGADQAATLRVRDVLMFDNPSDDPEETTITAVDSTANTVTVDPALAHNYAADATTTVTLVTPVALTCR